MLERSLGAFWSPIEATVLKTSTGPFVRMSNKSKAPLLVVVTVLGTLSSTFSTSLQYDRAEPVLLVAFGQQRNPVCLLRRCTALPSHRSEQPTQDILLPNCGGIKEDYDLPFTTLSSVIAANNETPIATKRSLYLQLEDALSSTPTTTMPCPPHPTKQQKDYVYRPLNLTI